MKSSSPEIFVQVIDEVLREEYNNPIQRRDYLTFFEMFDRNLSRKINESFLPVEILNNCERVPWGRIKYEGRMQWKLDLILKTLITKRINDFTGYLALQNQYSLARRYYYTQALLKELD